MPWAQFDDHRPDSVPWLRAGGEALGLHLLATLWCSAHISDGALPDEVVRLHLLPRFANPDDVLKRVESAGLWERVEGGWRLTHFLEDNRSREQVDADRVARQERARKGGIAKAAKDRAARPRTGSA